MSWSNMQLNIYLTQRTCVCTAPGGEWQEEGKAGFPLSGEPEMGLIQGPRDGGLS